MKKFKIKTFEDQYKLEHYVNSHPEILEIININYNVTSYGVTFKLCLWYEDGKES